jgi:hypothetical protein
MSVDTRHYECRGDAEWLETSAASGPPMASPSSSRAALEAMIDRAFHMRVLKEIAHISQNYPELPLVLTERTISIPRTVPDGFAVSIHTERGHYVVRLGEWRDEYALADEVVELVEAALRGDIRIRIDIDAHGQHHVAEQRLPDGEWIKLPHHEEAPGSAAIGGPTRTIFLRNGNGPA